jgi:excinuclease ABC subunit A
MADRVIDVRGAAEHNLADVDVTFGPGLTAVVGVSGSGKSSLAFDTVYNEARRRFMEALALGSPWARVPPARIRRIDGLGPAVSVAQNVVNRNPNSTVATAAGLHPFLRVLYARAADVSCPRCGTAVRPVSGEERLRLALEAVGQGDVDIEVPVVRGVAGGHDRLLGALRSSFGDALAVDGRPWEGAALDPSGEHDIVVRVARLAGGSPAPVVRAALERADGLGTVEVLIAGRQALRAPVCPRCGEGVLSLEPAAFRSGAADTSSHRIQGLTLDELLARPAGEVAGFADRLPGGPRLLRLRAELLRRLRPLLALGLDHLTLDRPMPTLSRGEAQRVRLAVVLSGRLEDLIHVLDEPTIGLHQRDLGRLFDAISALPGPVVMVEHDRTAVAQADDVVEIGPGGGESGGRVVFQGPPASLWASGTASGHGFAAERPVARDRRAPGGRRLVIREASARNLAGFDCDIPLGLLTVVTGPSGAGKTTLTRDVLLASLRAGRPVGCAGLDSAGLDSPAVRAVAVDQSPLGNNPRSNPATYTKVLDRIRKLFADGTGRSTSAFTFNQVEGACPECEGMGAIEVRLPFVAPAWITCEGCAGRRYRPEVLDARWNGMSIADVLDLSIDDAAERFALDRAIARPLTTMREVGLGYVRLGQPSPSLSGGEAQRMRLAAELARARPGDLVLLDEPTTGLHPADLGRLLSVVHRLADQGCTVIVVEHHPDVVAAADWLIDLGPGGGPSGGRLQHCGPPPQADRPAVTPRATPRDRSQAGNGGAIRVSGAHAHNLRQLDVEFARERFTVVTGVSGSGKSSLVNDVLAAEATGRLLECLSLYERQSVQEGPEAPVESLTGLGPTLVLDGARQPWGPRATVGGASELDRLVAVLLSRAAERRCLSCQGTVERTRPAADAPWRCTGCGRDAPPAEPRHLMGLAANAVCPRCRGLGHQRRLVESRLIRRPDEPICGKCLNSPGYYPRDYLCTPGTGGHGSLMAFAARYGFDPYTTPWNQLPAPARRAFVHGDPEPFPLAAHNGKPELVYAGWAQGDRWWWRGAVGVNHDIGGLYSEAEECQECSGRRLRPDYLTLRIDGRDRADLFAMPLVELESVLAGLRPGDPVAADALPTARRRLRFLRMVGLGYLHLDRPTWSLSAGEAQRVKLAAVLGGELRGMTILMDEPSRGLHPSEVEALAQTLRELCSAGNTVIAVEHDPVLIRAADTIIELGPGPGRGGGQLIDPASDASVTRALLSGRLRATPRMPRRQPGGWMRVVGARENNLRGADIRIPLGVQAGVCGVSGAGKSSLVVDTIGLALAPPKMTTGVAWRERIEAGACDAIDGAPARVVVCDQSRAAVTSAGSHLGIVDALRAAYADSEAAAAAGLSRPDLSHGCDACKGRGSWSEGMSFLPSVVQGCEACGGTGYRFEVASLMLRGRTLPDTERLSLQELAAEWGDVPAVGRACDAALRLGLGYLVVRQPGWSLSGGEAQRLKLARELARKATAPTLYLLDEPTVGLHAIDVARLTRALDEVVTAGHTVLVAEHDPQLLASCDWLIELGPGAGPDGGLVIFEGTPEELARTGTRTAPFVLAALS